VAAPSGTDGPAGSGVHPDAPQESHGSSASYLGYLLCLAGRPDLIAARHLHDRLPPEMPPMC
jgi:hypothetical protein